MTQPTPTAADFPATVWKHWASRPNKEGTLTPASTITSTYGTSDRYLLRLEATDKRRLCGTPVWHWTDGDLSFPVSRWSRKPVGTDGEDLDGTFLYERAATPPMTPADYTRLAQAAIQGQWTRADGRQELCLDPTTLLAPAHNLATSPIDVERALAALRAEGVTVEHHQPWTEDEGTPILFVQVILAPAPTPAAPCDECGTDVPHAEHLGNDGEYLCPDCYTSEPADITPCTCGGEGCSTCGGDGVIYPY